MGTTLKQQNRRVVQTAKDSAVELSYHLPIINQPLPASFLAAAIANPSIALPFGSCARPVALCPNIAFSNKNTPSSNSSKLPNLPPRSPSSHASLRLRCRYYLQRHFSSSPRVWARLPIRDEGGIEMDFSPAVRRDIDQIECRSTPRTSQLHRSSLALTKSALGTKLCSASLAHLDARQFHARRRGDQRYAKAKALFYSDASFSINCSKSFQSPSQLPSLQIDAGADAVQIFDSLACTVRRRF